MFFSSAIASNLELFFMANQEHLAIIRLGLLAPSLEISEIWNEWRKDNPEIIPDLSGAKLRKFHLQNIDFSNCNLQKIDLNRANLKGANLENANLQGAYLNKANLDYANLENANLKSAFLKDASIGGTDLNNANLEDANLDGHLYDSFETFGLEITCKELLKQYAARRRCFRGIFVDDIDENNLIEANLKGADFAYGSFHVNLTGTDFRNTNLTGSDFGEIELNKVDFRGATMVGVALNYVLQMRESNFSSVNLRKAKIYDANCEGCNFRNVNLSRAIIENSNLDNCMLIGANLTRANLSRSSFKNADLTNANLTGASNFNPENAILNNTILPDGTIANNIS